MKRHLLYKLIIFAINIFLNLSKRSNGSLNDSRKSVKFRMGQFPKPIRI